MNEAVSIPEPLVTPLHRVDPRLKLAACGLSAMLAFAAVGGLRLAVIAVHVLLLAVLARRGPAWVAGTLWPLRWLLLFTLLLHLFLSPGHTLLGVAWLSRDGLTQGLLVCGQLCIAVLAASLLTLTTPAGRIAQACGWLLAPLRRCGLPVRAWEESVFLVLRFFPIMRDELRATALPEEGRWFARIESWEGRLLPLFDRLVAHADELACRLATGRERLLPDEPLPPFGMPAPVELLILAGTATMLLFCLFTGG